MDRIERQKHTVAIMIGLYCRGQKHSIASNGLCTDCQELLDYATARLSHCRYGNDKPTCEHCPIHCYKPEMRQRIRQVMRYSGPRMLLHHPILCIRHLLEK